MNDEELLEYLIKIIDLARSYLRIIGSDPEIIIIGEGINKQVFYKDGLVIERFKELIEKEK